MRSTLATGLALIAIILPTLTACSNKDEEPAVAPSTVVGATTTVAALSTPPPSTSETEITGRAGTPTQTAEFSVVSEATATATPTNSGTGRELCGSSDIGLAVWAANTDCTTAMEVQSAFHSARGTSRNATLTVTVDGQDWHCEELQGQINPYLECANGAGTVRLTS